jgi:hypothetical protein
MMDALEAMEVWKMSRRLVDEAVRILRTRWLQFKHAKALYRLQFRALRLQFRSQR